MADDDVDASSSDGTTVKVYQKNFSSLKGLDTAFRTCDVAPAGTGDFKPFDLSNDGMDEAITNSVATFSDRLKSICKNTNLELSGLLRDKLGKGKKLITVLASIEKTDEPVPSVACYRVRSQPGGVPLAGGPPDPEPGTVGIMSDSAEALLSPNTTLDDFSAISYTRHQAVLAIDEVPL